MPDNEPLKQYIQKLLPMPDETALKLAEDFGYWELPKNEFLLKENMVSRLTCFLESGYVRSFTYDHDGQEVTTNIFSAPCFVNDFLSFFRQQPTKEYFQTLSDCRFRTMTFEGVQKNFHNIYEFREFGRLMLVHNYDQLNERMLGMIRDKAETRYLKLLTRHPDIFQHVPLKVIASYLGITDSSLSRIRREIVHK